MKTPHAIPLMRAPRRHGNREMADPCTMVIFGGVGDLTKRKLIPALYNLAKEEYLPRHFALVGIARSPMNSERFRDKITADMKSLYENDLDGDTWGVTDWQSRNLALAASRVP